MPFICFVFTCPRYSVSNLLKVWYKIWMEQKIGIQIFFYVILNPHKMSQQFMYMHFQTSVKINVLIEL